MATPIIGILNDSDIVSDHDFDIMVRACGRQLERDVAPLWGRLQWKVKAYASDFVTPAWFDAENPRGTRFDYLRKLTDPFELVKPGGYTTKNEADPKDVEVFGFKGELPVEKEHYAARTSRRVAMESVRRRKAKYGRKRRG